MSKYPLEIENIGADTYILMSRGHHDFREFMKAVKESRPTWPMGKPYHVWFKTIPAKGDYNEVMGWSSRYVETNKESRGAWPATVTMEAYGEELYNE